jgi:hypothetical protein
MAFVCSKYWHKLVQWFQNECLRIITKLPCNVPCVMLLKSYWLFQYHFMAFKVVDVTWVGTLPVAVELCLWIEIWALPHSLLYLIYLLQACKYALRQASPLLGGEKINTMIHDHLIDAGNLHYPDFMADLVKIIVISLKTHSFLCRIF